MTALQTLTVVLEVDNDGEFTTKIKSVDGVLKTLGETAQKTTKNVNSLSGAFAKASGTLSTFTTKLGNNVTALDKAMRAADGYASSIERAQQSVAALHMTVSGLTNALKESTNALGKFSTSAKNVATSVRTIAQNAGKGATGIRSLGDSAKKSTSSVNGFVTAASGVSSAISGWSRKANASGESVEKLGQRLASVTGEARRLRDELNAIQRTRGGASANKVARDAGKTRTPSGGSFDGDEQSANRYATAVNRVNEALDKSSKSHGSFVHNLTNAAFAIDEVFYAAQILWDVFGSGVEKIVDVNAHVEKLTATLKGLSTAVADNDRAKEAISQYNQLFSMAQRSPFSMDRLSEGFVKLKSGNVQDPINSLKSMSDALAHFSANDQQFESAMLAVMQMTGKGVISMEELRRQLGEAMPNAMKDMASAMRLTIPQLDKLVSTGSLQSAGAIRLMMDEFNRMYGGSSEQKMKTFSGQTALLNTNMQKLALTAGGMGMDGAYGPNSFYTEVARAVETLNKALESPEADSAARALNDSLASITRVLSSMISGFTEWGGTITSIGLKVVEFAAIIKGANLAVKALVGTMGAMEGSAFLKESGLMAGIMGIGSKTSPVMKKNPLGGSIKVGEQATAGYFSGAKTFMSGIAEQGVFGALAGGAGKAVAQVAKLSTGLVAMSGVEAAVGSSMAGLIAGFVGLTGVGLAAAAAIGAIALAWKAYQYEANRVKPGTEIISKATQNLSQGDVSKDTISAANDEQRKIEQRLQQLRDKQSHLNIFGGTTQAEDFSTVNGTGGVSGIHPKGDWFSRLMGYNDASWVDNGSAQAKIYAQRVREATALVESEQKRNALIISNAPALARNKNIEDDFNKSVSEINIRRRDSEASYAQTRAGIDAQRAQYAGRTDAASIAKIGQLNQQQLDAVHKLDSAQLAEYATEKKLIQAQADMAKAAGDNETFNIKIGVVNKLTDASDALKKSLDESEARLGKVDLTTAQKAMDREHRNYENWMTGTNGKMDEMQEQLSEGLPTSSATSLIQAWTSAGGKFADITEEEKNSARELAAQIDVVTDRVKNWKNALQAVQDIQSSLESSSKSFMSSFNDMTSGESPLGKNYSNISADIDSNSQRAIRGFDIDSTGLSQKGYSQIEEAIRQVTDSFEDSKQVMNDAAESMTGFGDAADESGARVAQTAGSMSVMSQTADTQQNAMTTLSDAMRTYELNTAAAGTATKNLGLEMQALSTADMAKNMAALSAVASGVDNDLKQARSRKESLESPSARRADQRQDIADTYNARVGVANKTLNSPQLLEAFARDQNLSVQAAREQLNTLIAKTKQAQDAQLQNSDLQFTKTSSRGGSRSNPMDKIKEDIAQYKAILDGADPSMAKFNQRMTDMGKTTSASDKALISQHETLKKKVDAQQTAIKNAQFFLQQSAQDHDKSMAQVDSLGLGDPDRVAGQIARVRAQYESLMNDVRKNSASSKVSAPVIKQLQEQQEAAVESDLSETLDRFQRSTRQIQESLADTPADKRAVGFSNLNADTTTMRAEIDNTGWDDARKQAAIKALGDYYDAEMQQIERSNEGTLAKTGRQWQDWDSELQEGLSSTMSGFMSNMADELSSGTANWKSFGQSILKVFSDITMKLAMSPIMSLMGKTLDGVGGSGGWSDVLTNALGVGKSAAGSFGSFAGDNGIMDFEGAGIAADGFHSGGIVSGGEQTFTRSVPASIFKNAMKYHTGGLAGDEVPTILQKGEGVFTKGQMKAIGAALNASNSGLDAAGSAMSMAQSQSPIFDAKSVSQGRSAPNISINFHNKTGNSDMKMSTSQPKWDGESYIIDTVIKHSQRPGNLRNALAK